jgi:hypothetical protein
MFDVDYRQMTDRGDGYSTKKMQMQHLELGTMESSARHLLRTRSRHPGRKGRQSRTILRWWAQQLMVDPDSICGNLIVSLCSVPVLEPTDLDRIHRTTRSCWQNARDDKSHIHPP